ncbi:MAG: hypothetical protein HY372_00660 [Candidatus Andersenbacteria bacterium]|nr:hypothetical protein [Candidatus Andersenbacteria bacterium]
MHLTHRRPLCTGLTVLLALLAASSHAAAPSAAPPPPAAAPAPSAPEVNAQEKELAALEAKISALKQSQSAATTKANATAQQIDQLSVALEIAELQLQQTLSTITAATRDIDQLTVELDRLMKSIAATRSHLGQVVRALYEHEQTTPVDIVLSTVSLGRVLSEQRTFETLQQRAVQLIAQLRQSQQAAAGRHRELAGRRSELERLHTAQAYQQAALYDQREQQQRQLSRVKQSQADLNMRLTEAQQTRREIAQRIFILRGVDLTTSLTDAFSAARYAAALTGVAPSLLLAILKVETNVGANLGSGVFPDDMHPDSREPFLRLMAKLGRDPDHTPISRRPAAYAGWGGAIGPGQFMPETWEQHAERLRTLMGKDVPDPFALPDALVAVGIMLADRGANDPARVVEAAARFLAGPNWAYHTWYSARVLAVADEYVREGLE